VTARQAAKKYVAKDGFLRRPMTTRSPYHRSNHHILTVVRATKNCSRHVTLMLDDGHKMIVDDIWQLYAS